MNDVVTIPDDIIIAPDGEVPPVRTAVPSLKEVRTLATAHLLETAFEGASKLLLTDVERAKLRERFPDDQVAALWNGLLYIPHIYVRNRLSETIGEGQWSMVAIEELRIQNKLYVKWLMVVRGCRVGESWCGKDVIEKNKATDLGDDYEASEGIAVRRIAAKFLHCGDQVWMPHFQEEWKERQKKPPTKKVPEPAKAEPTTLQSYESGLVNAALKGMEPLQQQWECIPNEAKRLLKPKLDELKEKARHADFSREMGDSLNKPAAVGASSAAPTKPPAPEQRQAGDEPAEPTAAQVAEEEAKQQLTDELRETIGTADTEKNMSDLGERLAKAREYIGEFRYQAALGDFQAKWRKVAKKK